jgi:ADP-dependent NAD(P)H-hydrate dehydratase / NAD(P)H-hydrate epimerase
MENIYPVYSVAQIRQIEAAFDAQFPQSTPLMQRAGDAVARHVLALLPQALDKQRPLIKPSNTPRTSKIVVLVGNGNNGGDGIVAALALQRAGTEVAIVFAITPNAIKHPLAQTAFAAFTANGGRTFSLLQAISAIESGEINIVVDAIFGIGLNANAKPIDSALYDFITRLNALRENSNLGQSVTVIAIDLPTGIDAETGAPCLRLRAEESQTTALIANETLTFIGHKAGLHTGDGVDYTGRVTSFDLEIPSALLPVATTQLLRFVPQPFAHRAMGSAFKDKRNVHKGTFGTAGIIGGASGMVGAGWLAARAALLCGAGKTLFMQVVPTGETALATVDSGYPEIMHSAITDALGASHLAMSSAIAIGPGLGQSTTAAAILATVLQQNQPLIIDADALTLIANDASLATHCAARHAITVFTPHPREASILLGCSTATVQRNRIAAAQKIAQKFKAIVVLKGAGSITADAHANVWINQSGNPGMSSGGMGDVLTGMLCAAFCSRFDNSANGTTAQRTNERVAQIVANTVWLHGHAADCCVRNGCGPIGLRASEVAEQARAIINTPISR